MQQLLLLLVSMLVAVHASAGSSTPLQNVTCRPDERHALLAFKSSFAISNSSFTGGCFKPYAKTESWTGSECCEWNGVTCDSRTGHVTELDLSCSLLNGRVSRQIGWLPHLTTLDLSGNGQLEIPDFETMIANLTGLRKLDLSFVRINSNLASSVFHFSNLGYLGLSGCGLRGEVPAVMPVLPSLTNIDLSNNMLSGVIPGWMFALPSLSSLFLGENRFTEIEKFKIDNGSSLVMFDASSNLLQGKIPDVVFDLNSLEGLYLDRNNLSGSVPLSKIHKLQSLQYLMLSDNKLFIVDDMGDDSTYSWPSFEAMSLSSCNLGHFPRFLRQQRNLGTLELSNNGIHGVVPDWIYELGALTVLNISHNSLSGELKHLPWKNMQELDIQNNLLQGVVPVPSPTTIYFWASSNKFTGEIDASFCDIATLALLDLAHNNLTGNIPECFASLISRGLLILDMKKNQLQGAIPSILFEDCPNLYTLSLSGNKLEGQIPQSLSNCSQMQLLDLSSNYINDTFPHWLGVLSSLEALVLGSNNLHGSLMESNTTDFFVSLRILDISNNGLTGKLPGSLLINMKAMVRVNNTLSWPYMGASYYQDSIVAWVKGMNRCLDAILEVLVLIDASKNRFEGHIPDVFGDLNSLRWLNLAHNNFTGHIPASLSKLTLLEALDLSSNLLEGSIPSQLVNLDSLEVFNVSKNHLVGPVPTGKQFDTFSDSSYLGNPSLCGPLLTNKCVKPNNAPPNSAIEGSKDESSGWQVWEIGLIGGGCGMLIGLVWGYLIFWVYFPYWAVRLIFGIETLVNAQERKRCQNRRRRQNRRR